MIPTFYRKKKLLGPSDIHACSVEWRSRPALVSVLSFYDNATLHPPVTIGRKGQVTSVYFQLNKTYPFK